MRSSLAVMVACAFLNGCASSPAQPLTANVPAAIVAPAPAPPGVPATRRIPIFGAACPLFFPPHEVGSVVRIPASIMSLAMDPVMGALCACTNRGEYATIVAEIDFGRGSARVRAPESPAIHECLETLHVTFENLPESDAPPSDCINCGPQYYGVFVDSPPPPKKSGMRLMYSFLLDRSSEVLDCPQGTHAERGNCMAEVAMPQDSPKRTCGCDPTDLECAIACVGAR